MKKPELLFLLTTAYGDIQTTDQEYDALTKKDLLKRSNPKQPRQMLRPILELGIRYLRKAYSIERVAVGG
tara:strand:+ start:80 stop:289 length:210 start_codon:yes stop_codon:yes gene_type:complete